MLFHNIRLNNSNDGEWKYNYKKKVFSALSNLLRDEQLAKLVMRYGFRYDIEI